METIFPIRTLQQPEAALQRRNFIDILLRHGLCPVNLLYICQNTIL